MMIQILQTNIHEMLGDENMELYFQSLSKLIAKKHI